MNASCRACHRPLKNPKSIEAGIGPICAAKQPPENGDLLAEGNKIINRALEESGAYFIPALVHDVKLTRQPDGRALADIPHRIVYHSPTGFEWGYGGSGPADLALNILAAFVPVYQAWDLHQAFKWKFVASVPHEGGTIKGEEILSFIKEHAPKP